MSEDITLLEQIQAGDREAFDRLVRKYQREIYFLALRFTKNEEDAEELAQQTFVKTFQKLESFEHRSSFKTWLYQVAMNQCRSFLRGKKQVLELNEEIAPAVAEEKTPLGRMIRNETAVLAAKEIESLPEKQKIIVTLRVFHEMSYREIGEVAGCSEETAKVNYHYGIENLRKKLKKNGVL